MYWKIFKPCAQLAPYIKQYWVLETDISDGEVTERVIPTGNLDIMFHYKRPFEVNKEDKIRVQPQFFLSGMSSHYSDVTAYANSGVVSVTFYPEGACYFFDFPLHEIENQIISLKDIDQKEIRIIEQQLFDAPAITDKIKIIEQFLYNRIRQVKHYDHLLVKQGLAFIKNKRGDLKVKELSKELFTTERTIERKFSAIVGKAPKQYIRLIRFHETINGLYQIGKKNLTEFAYDNGYFDQAHFINEFKSLSGYTPKEFLLNCPCEMDNGLQEDL